MAGLTKSTIGRKLLMALSAFFLILFLIVHMSMNFISVFSEESFNGASHFMETNPFIQFFMQPLLLIGVIFHFIMGFVLEIKNKKARPVAYAVNNAKDNSSWASRNMIISGGVILCFLVLHLGDFWFPTISKNYFGAHEIETSYEHLQSKFSQLWRVVIYNIAFILLGLHLAHGFKSAFQSMGINHPKYSPIIKAFGTWYSILIPLGFIIISIYHYVVQL